ncbi:hypothetical protein DFJ73DRAFT_861611 [Zopfochytrium polystomum]|nr:hypothetical protein DFJ73DRAFT_861611 [Zopfochytrium polystomum]
MCDDSSQALRIRRLAAVVERQRVEIEVHVLQWWKDSGLSFDYSASAMNVASQIGCLEVLDWWRDSGLELKYTEVGMDSASKAGDTLVLQWWKDSGCPLKYTPNVISDAISAGMVNSLKWWRDSGLPVKWNSDCFMNAGSKEVLEWWEESGLFQQWLESKTNTQRTFEVIFSHLRWTDSPAEVKQWWWEARSRVKQ